MNKYGGLKHFEDGGDTGSDGGDDGSSDAAPSGMDSEDAAMGASISDSAPAIGGPGQDSEEGSQGENAPGGANFGADLGFDPVASQMGLGVIEGGFGPGSSGFFSDLGYDPVASQMGLGVVGSGPVSAQGYTLGELQNMQANGLGSMSLGSQTVDQAVASLGIASITPGQIASVIGMINPALGTALSGFNTLSSLASGQTTVGQVVANLGLTAAAQAIGISPSTLSGIVNANPGQTIASLAGPVGSAVSTALGLANPGSSLASTINSALGTTPSGQTNTQAIASAINSAIGSGSPSAAPTATASSSPAPSGGLSIAQGEPPAQEAPAPSVASNAAPQGGSSDISDIMGALAMAGVGASALRSSPQSDVGSWLDTRPQAIKSNIPEKTPNTPEALKLAELQNIYDQIDPDLLALLVERGAIPAAAGGSIHQFASGGSSDVSCSMWGSLSKYAPKTVGPSATSVSTGPARRQMALAALKQINPQGSFGGMAKGGLPAKYREAAPDGHNPEFITGLTGFYANGRGTGQSDDIPAMLHDGDYVMDADTVAALGDGSSKAGAQALEALRSEIPHRMAEGGKAVPAKIADGEYVFPESFVTALGNGDNKRGAKMLDVMRENLRAHKRSAPTSKIPPKALSPLDYLHKSKG